jgi:hypothetical protein
MKFIITLLLIMCVSVCYAQDTNPVTQREIYNDFKSVMNSLAESLSTTSEHVYSILVKQATVQGLILFVFLILNGILIIILLTSYRRFIFKKIKESGRYDEDGFYAAFYIPTIIFCIVFVAQIFFVPDMIGQLVNPEYYAIKEILETVKGL